MPFTLSIEAVDIQIQLPKILVSSPVTNVAELHTALQNVQPYLNSTSLLQICLQGDTLGYNIHKTYQNNHDMSDDGSYRAYVYVFNPDEVNPGYISQDPIYSGNPDDEYLIYTGQGTQCKKNETIEWQLAIEGMEHFLMNPNNPLSPTITWKQV